MVGGFDAVIVLRRASVVLRTYAGVGVALLLTFGQSAFAQAAPSAHIPIRNTTSLGTIDATLDFAHAPVTVTNLLCYIDGGFFKAGRFHRTVTMASQPNNAVKIEVIQGAPSPAPDRVGFAPIAIETTASTGLKHLDGTFSMARAGPDSATSAFFICIDAQSALDFGGSRNADGQDFTAFGQVTAGMDVVRAIQRSAADGQNLTPPIVILDMVHR